MPGEVVVTDNGVTIIGYTDLPGRLPTQASQLYGTNLVNLMKLLTPGKDGQLVLDFDDVVQRVDHRGARRREDLAAAAGAGVGRPGRAKPAAAAGATAGEEAAATGAQVRVVGVGAVALFLLTAFSPNQLIGNFTVFVLAIVIGYYVIGNVHHALHTPLMSVTNAISGIIIVGALLQIGHARHRRSRCCRFVAILLASINIFGGFAVTRRMLGMFSREA